MNRDAQELRGSVVTPTPYAELNGVLLEFVECTQSVLGDSFVAACLQGSFATGGFDQHSDVDFVVVVEEELSVWQAQALQGMHERLYHRPCPWAQHLEGSYFPRTVLKSCARVGEPLWYLEHGHDSLTRSNHCNTVVVRWVVREHGVALAGADPASLVDPISPATLRQEIAATIRDWGREILAEPDRFDNRFYQSFIVLSYCRMLHDLETGRIQSKRAGATWAQATLDASWAGLIDRAWGGRPNPAVSIRQPANPDDFRLTLAFVEHIIKLATDRGGLATTDHR